MPLVVRVLPEKKKKKKKKTEKNNSTLCTSLKCAYTTVVCWDFYRGQCSGGGGGGLEEVRPVNSIKQLN